MKHSGSSDLLVTAVAFGVMYWLAGPLGVAAVIVALVLRG